MYYELLVAKMHYSPCFPPFVVLRYIDTKTTGDEGRILYYDRPALGKIDPSNCVDMPCEAKKKAIIYDLDGSVAADGKVGTIVPDAEFQWDLDRRYGTGDYRIPLTMVTDVNGAKLDAPANKGIVRDGTCIQHNEWNGGWKCEKAGGLDHKLFVIESMDWDTEDRRLSPIAVKIDDHVDLINGPQDHGWCFGYTCQERISTFHAIVAANKVAEIHMASTPPQTMRFHLLHSEATEGMVAKFYYPKSQRYDVYVDGTFVEATNGVWNDDNTKYNLEPRDDKYIPSHTGSFVAGENYFDPVEKFLYVVVTGQKAIEIKMKPVVVFKFGGSVPIDEVFNEDTIVSNIANILGIDPSLIRVSEIVKEGSRSLASDRNEPATKQVEYQVEISQPPAAETQSVTNVDAAR